MGLGATTQRAEYRIWGYIYIYNNVYIYIYIIMCVHIYIYMNSIAKQTRECLRDSCLAGTIIH